MKTAIILAAILLAGCASISGVHITEDERLAREFFMRGYQAGKSSL